MAKHGGSRVHFSGISTCGRTSRETVSRPQCPPCKISLPIYVIVTNKLLQPLTHWGRVTHICVGILPIIGSENGLSPGRRQAIIWTNAGILVIEPLGTNFSEILIGIQIFSFKKMRLKMSSAKWRPSCLGLNVLTATWYNSLVLYFSLLKISRRLIKHRSFLCVLRSWG